MEVEEESPRQRKKIHLLARGELKKKGGGRVWEEFDVRGLH